MDGKGVRREGRLSSQAPPAPQRRTTLRSPGTVLTQRGTDKLSRGRGPRETRVLTQDLGSSEHVLRVEGEGSRVVEGRQTRVTERRLLDEPHVVRRDTGSGNHCLQGGRT